MPVAMTFDSLLGDLRSYLERGTASDTEVHDQLPSLVNLAERQIARELKILGFIKAVTTNMAAGTSTYQKPDRWRDTVSINFSGGPNMDQRIQLFPRSYEYLRQYWPDPDEQDEPRFYADYDYSHWLIAPTPDEAYPFEILYYQLPPLLDDSNQTNWLTDHAPNALLYGTLVQATPFLKDDERIQTWQQYYTQAMSSLATEDLQRVIDRTTTRQET